MPSAADATETDAPATADWRALLAPYQRADDRVAAGQVAGAVAGYLALLALMGGSLRGPYGVTLLLALPTVGMLTRCFVLFHDCGHGSLFSQPRVNTAVGLGLSLLVWEAFFYWRHLHGMHHATSGHLDRRGTGDYDTWTVDEYRKRPRLRRCAYRVQREPWFLFLVLPFFKFTLYNRVRTQPAPPRAWRSVPWTNAALVLVYGGAALLWGWRELLWVMVPVFWLASLVGLWLFDVQHQFDGAYWARSGRWNRTDAALRGSSHVRLPPLLEWFTASIGHHHVHHLAPRIPNHRLARCHREQPLLQQAPGFGLRESLHALRCQLWDERRGRMVSFREAGS